MFCANCGNRLPDDADFCPNCGAKAETEPSIAKFKDVADSSDRRKKSIHYSHENNQFKKKYSIIYIILVVIGSLILIKTLGEIITEQNDPKPTGAFTFFENSNEESIESEQAISISIDDYLENPINFVNKYYGKRITFDSTFKPAFIMSDSVIFFASEYNVYLYCYTDALTITTLSTNNYYSIIGTFNSVADGPFEMINCEFILA